MTSLYCNFRFLSAVVYDIENYALCPNISFECSRTRIKYKKNILGRYQFGNSSSILELSIHFLHYIKKNLGVSELIEQWHGRINVIDEWLDSAWHICNEEFGMQTIKAVLDTSSWCLILFGVFSLEAFLTALEIHVLLIGQKPVKATDHV